MRAGDCPGAEGPGAEAQGRSPPPNMSCQGLGPGTTGSPQNSPWSGQQGTHTLSAHPWKEACWDLAGAGLLPL